ncbi:hypothetical protein RHGRI_014850 [Rhododendron griersonianum]|uniref:Neprosin PEP catalytic domain-containing protein n=1 Tax=Rhododendron griersonianum TaxID=479676 RepID=A0AAV6KB09_9ERIC|nr:hypothetical protein RHGRI_014850 [Rhododendron griersonianum]
MGITVIKRKSGVSTLHLLLLLLLLLHFLSSSAIFSGKLVVGLNYTKHTRRVGSLRLSRIQRHLEKINKPPVFTIESPDGDVIDCVHKRKQPALDHPLLKNHKIQRHPPERPKSKTLKREEDGSNNTTREGMVAWQTWHRKGERCPKGTVPIRRSTVDDVLRAKSLYDFGKKQVKTPLIKNGDGGRQINAPDVVSGNGHEHAIAYTGASQEVYGAKATINVWDPSIEEVNEFSLSQIWVLSGSFDGSDLNSIEAGWQDPKLGNWWMSFGASMLVGYWPAELFTHLDDGATMVEWGGEVVNSRTNNQHTTTQMGSGQFAEQGFGKASYFRNLEVVDSDNSLSSAQGISTLAENVNCYDIKSFSNSAWGTYFYYGGPGYNPKCP